MYISLLTSSTVQNIVEKRYLVDQIVNLRTQDLIEQPSQTKTLYISHYLKTQLEPCSSSLSLYPMSR